MGFILRIIILWGLVKLLLIMDKPHLCAGIYAVIGLALRFLLGWQLLYAAIATVVSFLLAWLYFWLLRRFEGSVWFWIIMIGGIVVGLV